MRITSINKTFSLDKSVSVEVDSKYIFKSLPAEASAYFPLALGANDSLSVHRPDSVFTLFGSIIGYEDEMAFS